METQTSAITLLLVVLFLVSQTTTSKIRDERRPNPFGRQIKFSRTLRQEFPNNNRQSLTRTSGILTGRTPKLIPVQLSSGALISHAPMPLPPRSLNRIVTERTAKESNCEGAQIGSQLAPNDGGGVAILWIPGIGFKKVFCDVGDEGGNWTVFQRRKNGNVDFFRNWADYVNGFGDFENFWLGLEALHQMTREGDYELKINMITTYGVHLSAKYRNFRIGPGSSHYTLSVSGYSGNATDSLAVYNNQPFTTKDADHDRYQSENCATRHKGAWWFDHCGYSNLNGLLTGDFITILWKDQSVRSTFHVLLYSEMKFRRRF